MIQKRKTGSFLFTISLFLLMQGAGPSEVFSSANQVDNLTITVKAGDYRIKSGDGSQRIEMEGFGYLMVPGKPLLPAKNFLIALPPGARVQSVEVKGIGACQLPGPYQIIPTPPILPIVDPSRNQEIVRKLWAE